MSQLSQRIVLVVLLAAGLQRAGAFSLGGPPAAWQVQSLGYQIDTADIQAPMYLGEEYRWNAPVIYYGYDPSFLDYFGQEGVNAIDQLFRLLNNLPAMSQVSDAALADTSRYPLDSRRFNYQASALGLRDLKSYALSEVLLYLGVAGPERWAWSLRNRYVDPAGIPHYTTIQMNWDPFTLRPTPYVNGTLYTYQIIQTYASPDIWEAVDLATDPLKPSVTSVAALHELPEGTFDLRGTFTLISPGMFYDRLTREDVAALRYIYRLSNSNVESLPTNAVASPGGGGPWGPPPGATNYITNIALTNFVVTGLRPGIDKLQFVRVDWDSMLGQFTGVTNYYTDFYITNGFTYPQGVARTISLPDIVFGAADIGVDTVGIPLLLTRTTPWVNNDALNGTTALGGPGQIAGTIAITFNKVGLYWRNTPEGSEADATIGLTWGSFDGTTNAPIVYPVGSSIQQLEQLVMSNRGNPWGPP